MKNKEQKWEQVLKVMESSMELAKHELWIAGLQLMKVDEYLQAIFVSARDPFKGAYVMDKFGENLDRAAEIVFGSGYKVYVTYDKKRKVEEDYLSVTDNEFTLVKDGDDYKHHVRMLLLTNTDVTDDDLDNIILRMQDCMKKIREREPDGGATAEKWVL